MSTMLRSVILVALALSLALPAGASDGPPVDVSELLLPDGPVAVEVDPELVRASGEVEIWVQLLDAPLAVANGRNAKQLGGKLNPAQQRSYLRQLAQKQDALMSQVRALGGRELGRVGKAHNAVAVAIDASQIVAVAALPNVRAIRPVVNYELDLSTVRSYILPV